eukprot:scaffold770_cov255-Pinguiococcus_pyrenoidosus.AAC.3
MRGAATPTKKKKVRALPYLPEALLGAFGGSGPSDGALLSYTLDPRQNRCPRGFARGLGSHERP